MLIRSLSRAAAFFADRVFILTLLRYRRLNWLGNGRIRILQLNSHTDFEENVRNVGWK